ncbi:MAG: alpha-2-macroglobulin family protein [bacterium]
MRYLLTSLSLLSQLACACRPAAPPPSPRNVAMPVFTEAELAAADTLRVTAATPVGEVESKVESDEVLVTFSEPMVEPGAVADPVDFPLLLEPDLPGSCHWLGNRIIVFRPAVPLTPATEFRVRVPRGVRSLEGSMLKEDYEFSFSTVRPRLEHSSPWHGSRMVGLEVPILLRFNLPMDPRRAAHHIRLVEDGGAGRRVRVSRPRPGLKPDEWWYSDEDSARILVVEPVGRLRIETSYRLVLEAGLAAREGNLGMAQERVIEFRTFNRFRFEGAADADGLHPEDELTFWFSNPVQLSEVADNVLFTPAVEFPARYRRRDWVSEEPSFALGLAPETRYRVRLSKWLKDVYGNRLGRDVTFDLRTVSYRPSFTMLTGPGVVESEGELLYPVRLVNIDSLAIRMRRLEPAEVAPFWRAAYERDDDSVRPWQRAGFFRHARAWRPGLEWNQRALMPIRLEPGLGGARSGFLFVELDGYEQVRRHSRFSRAFLQVTPYGLTGKFSPENGLALVTRLGDASPVAGAALELRDDENRLVWQGRTGPDGMALLPGWQALGVKSRNEWSSPRLWLFCRGEAGEAFVHSDWGTGIGPWEFGVNHDWNPDPTRPRAFLFTEKGLYRAGDTVRVKGMVRSRRLGRWVLPVTRRGRVRVCDSRGDEVAAREVTLGEFGGFDLSVPLRPDAVSGSYSVLCEFGEDEFHGSFRVEAYRPAEFDVRVESGQKEYIAGDELAGTVEARYLFGAAMGGERVSWSVSLSPTRHEPPGWDGYEWGPAIEDWRDEYRQLASGSGRLDEAGRLAVRARLNPGAGLSDYRVNLEAEVTTRDERSIAGRGSWLLHRAEFHAGVKVADPFVVVGDSASFRIVAAGPDGTAQPGQSLSVTVFRRVWLSARKAQTGGRYGWLSEPKDERVASFRVRTGIEPVQRSFRPDRPGYYWLRVEGQDRRRNPVRTDANFWVAGPGEASWLMKDDDLLELVRDRPSYRPGDTARILVKSPWQNVRALVTIEREHVLDRFMVDIKGNADYVRVPVREEYLPNAFVSVMLFKGRTADAGFGEEGQDLGKPAFRVGYVELPVEAESRRLRVKLGTGRDEYEPGDTVELDIEVRHRDGGPARAEVVVAVVDLGVLRLIGFETPDPFAVFYAPRWLSVATVESRLHVVGQRNYGQKGGAAGDGEVRGASTGAAGEQFGGRFREKFLETALWLPAVRTGADGRARVRVVLPDNLTTWQAMAVAATVEEFGSGEARFRANKPLLLAPSLPRFMRPGDEFRAGVMVHNRTGRELEVEVRARGSGAAVIGSQASRRVSVRPGEPVELVFDWRCEGDGPAEVSFEAAAGSYRDALRLPLPVRNPLLVEAVALFESSEDSLVTQWLSVPADALPGVGGLEITAASSGLAGLERGLEYLRTYPYECLEQRLSKVLPFVAGEELINEFGLSDLRGAELRKFVQGELDQVGRYQDQAGGFRFWAGEGYRGQASPYLSAYCLYVLGRAREAGYPVDAKVAALGRAWLLNWLSYSKPGGDWPYSADERLATRALALHALSLWDADAAGQLNLLVESIDQLSTFGKACLLKALARAGAREAANRVASALLNKVKLSPTTAHFEEATEGGWVWHSNVRTTAAVLEALLSARGGFEHAEKVARWLLSERRAGRWRTTQENAYVFDALAAYYRAYEKVTPDFALTVRLEGREALAAVFRGRALSSRRAFLPMAGLKPGRSAVELDKRGPGRLYYGLRLSYAPTGELKPRSEGFRVEKTIRPAEGRQAGYRRGQSYLVTLTVNTDQERLYVVLDDPLPAGFEIVNTSFATESRALAERLGEARQADASPWQGGFDHEEAYDDRYVLFATSLARGTHTKTYLMKALTPGRFLAPPVKVEEMYAPEVFGYTGQQVIEVE